MPIHVARANGKRSAIRAHIEHVVAEQKARIGLFMRTIGLANLVDNMRRLLRLERQAALA